MISFGDRTAAIASVSRLSPIFLSVICFVIRSSLSFSELEDKAKPNKLIQSVERYFHAQSKNWFYSFATLGLCMEAVDVVDALLDSDIPQAIIEAIIALLKRLLTSNTIFQ